MLPATSETVPLVGFETAVTVMVCVPSSGPALSLPVRSVAGNASGVSSGVLIASATATGASFTSVTVMLIVYSAEVVVPSLIEYVNESVPAKFAFGEYVRLGAAPVSTPFAGVLTVNVSGS